MNKLGSKWCQSCDGQLPIYGEMFCNQKNIIDIERSSTGDFGLLLSDGANNMKSNKNAILQMLKSRILIDFS